MAATDVGACRLSDGIVHANGFSVNLKQAKAM
jgi:hypothetical protein